MQIRIFTVPVLESESLLGEMNGFLRAQKVLSIDKNVVSCNGTNYWTFCVTYLPQDSNTVQNQNSHGGKVDYKEVLDESSFLVFTRLRGIRKQLAEQDAVPAYAVFTDSELAEISKLKSVAVGEIKKIHGIGQKKIEKYGDALCGLYESIVKEQYNGTGRPSDTTDSIV